MVLFCVFCLDYVRLFWEWSKETETLKQRDVFWSHQLCFFFLCFSVFFFIFYFLFFFILGSDSKGIVRSCLITVLRTVWLNCRLNSSLLFGHRLVLKLKNRDCERFTVFSVGPYGPVRVSKLCFKELRYCMLGGKATY